MPSFFRASPGYALPISNLCEVLFWYVFLTPCISRALELRGAGPIEFEGVIQNSFPVFSSNSGQTHGPDLDFRPMNIVSSLCRIIDPNTACPQTGSDSEFVDIDFALSLVHPNLTQTYFFFGLTEPVEDVFSFPMAKFAFVPVFNLGQAIDDTNQNVVLDVSVLADIIAAEITNWRDPRILESLNKAGSGDIAKLMPDANITFVLDITDSMLEFATVTALSEYSEALRAIDRSGFGNLWHWLPHRIVHYNKDDVIGTIFFTESTITLLPSMVVARHQLQTVKLRHGEGPVVRPEPDGISAAVLEAGLVFGIDTPRIPIIHQPYPDIRSVYSWPLLGYIYGNIRTNIQGDRLRPGATCEHVMQTINYFDWLTTASSGRVYLNGQGTSALPLDMSKLIIKYMKNNTLCQGEPLFIPSPPSPPIVSAKVTTIMCQWLVDVFAHVDPIVIAGTAHPFGGVAICSDDYIEAGDFPPDILYMTLPQLDRSLLPKDTFRVPFFFYEFVVLANLWSIDDVDKEFIVSMDIIKDIYMGKINKWNDSRLTTVNPDLQATNATIHVLKVCGLEDHSMVLRGILGVDFCSVTLPGERIVSDYIEMEAMLLTTPFSLGLIPNFRTNLQFEIDLNIAAFITSPPQSPSTFNSSNHSISTEAVVVSILKTRDRLRALEACLDENSLTDGTILIDHSRNPHCYPLTHVIEGVVTSMFAKTTCQQSPLPTALFGYISIGLSNLLLTPLMTFDGIYSPYSSLQYGLSIYQAMDTSLRAALKCGDQLLITPDSFEDSSERIMQDSPIFFVCATGVALISALMVLSAIALSAKLDHPLIRSAGGITLVVYIGFLFFKMTVTVLLMYDSEQLKGICLMRPILFLIGVTGSSAVLFFRMLRVYRIFCTKDLFKTVYNNKWVIKHVITVVLVVTVIMIPIYIVLGGGQSSRHTTSEDTVQLMRFFVPYQSTSVEYISLCDSEEMMFLAALGVHTIFLAANLFLGVPLWSVDERYSDAHLIVFTSVLAIVFSAPNWTLYFFWRNDAYNNAVTLVAFANLSECTLMLFMFAISRLFGTISRRILGERIFGSDPEISPTSTDLLRDRLFVNSNEFVQPKRVFRLRRAISK